MEFDEVQALWLTTHTRPAPKGTVRQRALAAQLPSDVFADYLDYQRLNDALYDAMYDERLSDRKRRLMERIWADTDVAEQYAPAPKAAAPAKASRRPGGGRRENPLTAKRAWGRYDASRDATKEREEQRLNGRHLVRRVNPDGSLNPEGFDLRYRMIDFGDDFASDD